MARLRGSFGIWGPLSIYGAGEDKSWRFGVWMEFVTYWPYNQRERGPGHATDFEILGPLSILETAEGRKVTFGMWLDYVKYKLAGDKLLPSKNAYPFTLRLCQHF